MSYTEIRVLELHRNGLRPPVIAARVGRDISTVYWYLNKHRLIAPHGKAKHDANAQQHGFADAPAAIRAWAAEGLTNAAIGDRLGCHSSRVSVYIRDLGGVERPSGRGRVAR